MPTSAQMMVLLPIQAQTIMQFTASLSLAYMTKKYII